MPCACWFGMRLGACVDCGIMSAAHPGGTSSALRAIEVRQSMLSEGVAMPVAGRCGRSRPQQRRAHGGAHHGRADCQRPAAPAAAGAHEPADARRARRHAGHHAAHGVCSWAGASQKPLAFPTHDAGPLPCMPCANKHVPLSPPAACLLTSRVMGAAAAVAHHPHGHADAGGRQRRGAQLTAAGAPAPRNAR